MSFNSTSIANLSDSDDESYEAGLARRCAEVENLLRQQEEKERLERQARKEAKMTERKRLGEEAHKKTGKGKDTAERRRSPERSGQTFRGRSCCCHGTTTAQELVEDLSAALISSF